MRGRAACSSVGNVSLPLPVGGPLPHGHSTYGLRHPDAPHLHGKPVLAEALQAHVQAPGGK